MTEIWQAGQADWRAYRDIRLAALTDAPDAFGSTLERELRFTEADWRSRLTTSAVFLGSINGKVRATAAGLPTGADEAVLIGVWAHPEARGTGPAAEVIQAVLDWGKDRSRITLSVAEGNEAARRLYARLGFRPTGDRKPMAGRPHIIEIELARTASVDGRQP